MDKRGPKSKNPEPRNQGNDEKKSKKGLRLLARVKPSEIFLKSITKDVTNVQITYPCRFVEDLDLSRRRLYGFYLVVAKTVFLGFKEWQRNRALSAFRKNTEHFVRNQFLMLLLVHPQVTFLNDYVLEGSEGTPFAGGYYYGKIKFPPEYPYKPPGITMITPNGRFMTQKKICLSMSDFHPESWNSMWSVSRLLVLKKKLCCPRKPTF
ncbi:hypothetical protein E1A91_D05G341900v1 [Gossypium mustelinum]|uniref:UBC core domain-containing protein n=1 Tax=Gossypium mustelinum TaxID=34275 RepID=A0A5D2U4L4_GOSMU|nr:hypothetical protein E1A91_D07G056100v1 [Gossypium mustelinum]TYI84117.1 hypothetical protein E1A91_D05G341900v1 [Gossypium mustelinum]